MVEINTASAPAPAAPRKQSKLMADLSAAIRATAEAAREQALAQVDGEAKAVVDTIRERSTDGATTLRQKSEDDIAAIREWSKAELARIREETDERIASRKSTLDGELAGHAAAVERRVEEVQAEVARFEAAMMAYMDRLGSEDDPARLATMAEEMPELPQFEAWADLGTLDIAAAAQTVVPAAADEAPTDTWTTDAAAAGDAGDTAQDDAPAIAEASAESTETAPAAEAVAAPPDDHLAAVHSRWGEPETDTPSPARDPWATESDVWGTSPATPASDSIPGDRGERMAAMEAAAEAVVADVAAEDTTEAANSMDTAGQPADAPPAQDGDHAEAEAALLARMDAGALESNSFASRLASLLPGVGEGDASEEPRTTQVIVTGLVSVASIASFKRHLSRLAGVQNVAVASGPEGEFVFNLTHRADLSFRDAIPTLPGFAARVTGMGDGVVQVTARDPETEG